MKEKEQQSFTDKMEIDASVHQPTTDAATDLASTEKTDGKDESLKGKDVQRESESSAHGAARTGDVVTVMEAEGYVSLEETKEYKCIVDQTFMREEDFYEFYNDYAYHKGFSIRKGRVRYKTGTKEVIWRRLMCSCEGYRSVKYFERMDQKRQPRALTRCGCTARLDVEWSEIIGTWYVKDFVDVHTHALAKPEHVFVLRSHRGLNDPQKVEVVELGLGGLRPFQIMDVMEASHGGPWETGFLSQDLYNFFSRYKKGKVEGSDVEFVLNHMRQMQEKDPEFFFTFSVDAQGRLKNLFWSDAQSQIDYGVFGDVVVFDSTYRVNRYNLPFVPFIGVNHHRSTVVFGCGILSDETILSYVWLLEALLEAMHQKHPKSLITDGDAAMMRAIEIVMPDADHRLCSWHIEQNMLKRFRGLKLKDFRKFIYHAMEEGEFDRLWREFRGTHNIKEDNLWVEEDEFEELSSSSQVGCIVVALWLNAEWQDTTAAFLPMDRSSSNSFIISASLKCFG
ncbi:protein FAR1-RELATED SEQUENCE 5-like [Setaria italica]|uniref:protein FAR1-RELATED SEQUENCE 5-like n=1 Tax=Setaria italica TaxID=4555 RepID=UPI000BE5013C|nr:protein FAR1-RELATED SEQUENCE 5-like [Setaria italica]